jgi:hypothetical protein
MSQGPVTPMKTTKMNPGGSPGILLPCLIALGCLAQPLLQAATTESNLSKTFPAKPGGHLVVDADRGSIEITTGDRSDVAIDVKRKIPRASPAQAADVFAAHEVTFDQDGDRVEVHAKFKQGFRQVFNRGAGNMEVRYEIQVPRRFNLDLRTAAGNVTCADIEGSVKARVSGGGLKFAAVKGPFDGTTAAGNIDVERTSGPVSAKTSGGTIRLGPVDADVTAETSAGSIKIGNIQGKLSARTHGGSIDVGAVTGAADLDTSAGSITIASVGAKLSAQTRGGSIDAGELEGPAELQTSAGSIRVKAAHAVVAARTSGGSVRIDDAKDAVVAHTSAGSITVAFSAQPQSASDLSTSGGGIDLKLDGELGFDVDARCSGGEIRSELPITTKVVGGQKGNELKGTLNGGGKGLLLRTSAGNIHLRKL